MVVPIMAAGYTGVILGRCGVMFRWRRLSERGRKGRPLGNGMLFVVWCPGHAGHGGALVTTGRAPHLQSSNSGFNVNTTELIAGRRRHAAAPPGRHYHGAARLSARGAVVSARGAVLKCTRRGTLVYRALRLSVRITMAQCTRHSGSVHERRCLVHSSVHGAPWSSARARRVIVRSTAAQCAERRCILHRAPQLSVRTKRRGSVLRFSARVAAARSVRHSGSLNVHRATAFTFASIIYVKYRIMFAGLLR